MAYWDPDIYGKLIHDNDFDMAKPESQEFLFQFCQDLRNTDLLIDNDSLWCWIESFEEFLTAHN